MTYHQTNLAMQYINYPAKTLMKSSRVVFTMMFGVLIQRKVYKRADCLIVVMMVAGLATFMHADASSSAVFHHMGVIMLLVSLFCDGAISNVSMVCLPARTWFQEIIDNFKLTYSVPFFVFFDMGRIIEIRNILRIDNSHGKPE